MNRRSRLLVLCSLLVLPAGAVEAQYGPGRHPGRYQDQGDGTVKDLETGLTWLADAGCLGTMSWERAKERVAALGEGTCGLTDGSKPGDWRLPTEAEWESMVDCSCGEIALSDDRGTGCYSSGESAFHGVQASDYWSATESVSKGTIRVMSLRQGLHAGSAARASLPVWPVRD